MQKTLFAALLGLFLCWNPVAYAQDDTPAVDAPTTEEAAAPADAPPAEEPAAEEAPADDAAPEGTEGESEKAEADVEDAAEGDEAAAEGEDKAEAPEAPTTDEEALETGMLLVEALKAGQWPMAVGLLLTLLVYLVNRFALKGKVDEKVIPWIAFGVGVAGAAGTGLVTGVPVVEAVVEGVMAGVAAVGGWEMALKHVTAPKEPKADEAPKEEPKADDEPKTDPGA
ncbi:phage holin family protein [Deltaproteobacteria bacterium]|nr:phage holin family protein [Deltaproteobacteria bacterium]